MGKRRQRKKRKLNKLEPVSLKKLKPGMHGDGGGLYLIVQESGSRSWILRTMVRGARKDIGLGALSTRSLADARDEAAKLLGDRGSVHKTSGKTRSSWLGCPHCRRAINEKSLVRHD